MKEKQANYVQPCKLYLHGCVCSYDSEQVLAFMSLQNTGPTSLHVVSPFSDERDSRKSINIGNEGTQH